MVVLSLSLVIGVILHRTLFDSQVEYISSRLLIDELRARYNAQSGMELSLLRVKVFKEVQRVLTGEKQEALLKPYVDFIWREPMVWPLDPVEDMSEVDKDSLRKTKAESFLKGSYSTQISPEDGKINLNALASPVNYLREFTIDSLMNLIINESENILDEKTKPEDTDEKVEGLSSEALIKALFNLADWVDKDDESRSGGSERRVDPDKVPLNRSFLFVEEIRNVPGITEEIYRILRPYVSAHGSLGLNINYAEKPLLKALGLSEELAAVVLSRTQPASAYYKPFAGINDFCDFMTDQGGDLCSFLEEKFSTLNVLKFNTPSHFSINGRGGFKGIHSQMEALIYDANLSLRNYKEAAEVQSKLIKEEKEGAPDSTLNDAKDQRPGKREKSAKKTYKIQYQSFSPIHIMYWKEN